MGLFDRIKKAASNIKDKVTSGVKKAASTVSNTYESVDEKIGGILPAGAPRREEKTTINSIPQRSREEEKEKREGGKSGTFNRERFENRERPTFRGRDEGKKEEDKESFIDKAKEVAKKALGLGDDDRTIEERKGTDEQRAKKVAELENEIAIQKAQIEQGDKYEFLYNRNNIIAEAEKEILRLEAGGDLDKPIELRAGIVPIGFGAGAAGAGGTIVKNSAGAMQFVKNSKTAAQTTRWLTKIGSALKSPYAVAGGLVSAIGSYPFAGFIKEEALQTMGFATKSAIQNGDIAGADAAIKLQEQTLNPDLWDQILGKIPFANILNELQNFYDAARTKVDIDKKIVADLKKQAENGETEDEKWERIFAEQEERQQERIERELEFERQLIELQRRAAAEKRKLDEKYWDKVMKERRERMEKDREAELKYQEEYMKRWQEIREETAPSALSFGLL